MFDACNNSLLAERVCDVNQGFLFRKAALLCFGALVLLRTWSATSCICSVSRRLRLYVSSAVLSYWVLRISLHLASISWHFIASWRLDLLVASILYRRGVGLYTSCSCL